jgi:hypothetical protein
MLSRFRHSEWQNWRVLDPLLIETGSVLTADLEISDETQTLKIFARSNDIAQPAIANTRLTSDESAKPQALRGKSSSP